MRRQDDQQCGPRWRAILEERWRDRLHPGHNRTVTGVTSRAVTRAAHCGTDLKQALLHSVIYNYILLARAIM
jgi:hypothetical protein